MQKVAVVTGAGSGVGRAVVQKLAEAGWQIALLGRRVQQLEETVALCRQNGQETTDYLVYPCDIQTNEVIEKVAGEIIARWGRVDALINAAGTNIPARKLSELKDEDYHLLLNTNLNGAFYCVQAFLPRMRSQKEGTIINIVSEAGLKASPKAGVAYVISKFGLAGLTQALNAEERDNGIRATSIFPGDINTAILDRRPQPPTAEARAQMLQAEDVAACVMLALNLPARAIIEELVIRPR